MDRGPRVIATAEGLGHADAVLALDATGDTIVSAHLSLRAMRTASIIDRKSVV